MLYTISLQFLLSSSPFYWGQKRTHVKETILLIKKSSNSLKEGSLKTVSRYVPGLRQKVKGNIKIIIGNF